jgi:dTDP-4-amino-4,6-dideoxygalactose transaminase
VTVPFLDLKRRSCGEDSAIRSVLDSGRFIGGRAVHSFESSFADYAGAPFCVAVANGTDALELALRAAGVQAGDEVATVANAGMYATTAIRSIGAVPLYVDVDPETFLISLPALEAAADRATRAVVITHLYGRMARMPEIMSFANHRDMIVVEDCAQSHGARLSGRHSGTWGVAGAFSFYPTKNLGAMGDAGAIVTSRKDIADRVRALREYGWDKRFYSAIPGGRNSRMDEIQAAVLNARLPFLDDMNRKRREIAEKYAIGISSLTNIDISSITGDSFVAHQAVITCQRRDELAHWLSGCGVETMIHYPVPDHLQRSQNGLAFRKGSLEATEVLAKRVLSLPCFPELRDDEAGYVINCLSKWKS